MVNFIRAEGLTPRRLRRGMLFYTYDCFFLIRPIGPFKNQLKLISLYTARNRISGRGDLNPRLLGPEPSALPLRYCPFVRLYRNDYKNKSSPLAR